MAGTENLVDLRMVETIAVLEESTRYKGKKVVVVVIVVVVIVVVVVLALEGRRFGCEAGATLGGPAFWL